jgi:hypothetical protein
VNNGIKFFTEFNERKLKMRKDQEGRARCTRSTRAVKGMLEIGVDLTSVGIRPVISWVSQGARLACSNWLIVQVCKISLFRCLSELAVG